MEAMQLAYDTTLLELFDGRPTWRQFHLQQIRDMQEQPVSHASVRAPLRPVSVCHCPTGQPPSVAFIVGIHLTDVVQHVCRGQERHVHRPI